MKKAVKIIAIFASAGCFIYFIVACAQLSNREISWVNFIVLMGSIIINLMLLWALSNALTRIERLEKDIYKLSDQQSKDKNNIIEEDPRPFKQCKNCGSIQRTNDKICSKCNMPYDDMDKD